MYKTGLVLSGLIGGMVMLGGAPALAEGYTTAPVFGAYTGDDDDDEVHAHSHNRTDVEKNDIEKRGGEWNVNGKKNSVIDIIVLNDLIEDVLNVEDNSESE